MSKGQATEYTIKVVSESAYPWHSQKKQYPVSGEPGISYFGGDTEWGTVDCLLWRDSLGNLRGILNHYPFSNKWERSGNVNIFVDPTYQRKGVATDLLNESRKRWPFDIERQTFTLEGVEFIKRYLVKYPI